MKRTIRIEIDCDDETCGACKYVLAGPREKVLPRCMLFRRDTGEGLVGGAIVPMRLPECRAAEAKSPPPAHDPLPSQEDGLSYAGMTPGRRP